MFICLFLKHRFSSLLFSPSQGWLRGGWQRSGRAESGRGWELACSCSISSGLQPGDPQSLSHPFAVWAWEESWMQCLSHSLAHLPQQPVPVAEGLFVVFHTCRFKSKEWSTKIICRDSPTLWFFPLCKQAIFSLFACFGNYFISCFGLFPYHLLSFGIPVFRIVLEQGISGWQQWWSQKLVLKMCDASSHWSDDPWKTGLRWPHFGACLIFAGKELC